MHFAQPVDTSSEDSSDEEGITAPVICHPPKDQHVNGQEDASPAFEICHPPKEDNVIGQKEAKKIFEATILGPTKFPKHQARLRPKSRIKALLFYGPPGTGKTSTILACAKEIYKPKEFNSMVLELNASDDRGN